MNFRGENQQQQATTRSAATDDEQQLLPLATMNSQQQQQQQQQQPHNFAHMNMQQQQQQRGERRPSYMVNSMNASINTMPQQQQQMHQQQMQQNSTSFSFSQGSPASMQHQGAPQTRSSISMSFWEGKYAQYLRGVMEESSQLSRNEQTDEIAAMKAMKHSYLLSKAATLVLASAMCIVSLLAFPNLSLYQDPGQTRASAAVYAYIVPGVLCFIFAFLSAFVTLIQFKAMSQTAPVYFFYFVKKHGDGFAILEPEVTLILSVVCAIASLFTLVQHTMPDSVYLSTLILGSLIFVAGLLYSTRFKSVSP